MKSHYFIKPIRIRFMSGGVECSNLEQLRHNFSPVGVVSSISEFHRWLTQNRNEENEIGTILDELITYKNSISIDSSFSIFVIYKIVFKEFIENNRIESLVDLFHYWSVSQEYRSSFKLLKKDIKNLPWNEGFYYNLAEKEIKEKGSLSEEQLYNVYGNYLDNDFVRSEGKDLISIYLYLAKKLDFKESFSFLEGIIRENKWHVNFFLRLIPCLFVKSIEGDDERLLLPDYANLNFSLETEQGFYNIYSYFLDSELKKRKIKALPDLFFLFISNSIYKSNFDTIHEIVKDAHWSLDFAYRTIPQLLNILHQKGDKSEIFINEMFSNDDEYKLFSLYHFFLSGYLWKNDKICILKFLYLFWDRNKECLIYFNQLHSEIARTPWGVKFFDGFFEEIVCAHLNVSCLSYDKCLVLDEKAAFYFFSKHYQFYLNEKKINNISDLYVCWCKDEEYKGLKCFEFLDKVLKNNLWGVWKMLDIYKHHRELYKSSEWTNILTELSKCETEKKQHLFEIGKIFIDDYSMFDEGCSILKDLYDMKMQDAISYIASCIDKENQVSEQFKESYSQLEDAEWSDAPEGRWYFKTSEDSLLATRTLREKWILITQELIHVILCENDKNKISRFVIQMREIYNRGHVPFGYSLDSPKEFFSIFRREDFYKIDRGRMELVAKYDGKSFLEVRFVFGLICKNYSQYSNEGDEILKSISSYYKPAHYLLNENDTHLILDKMEFRKKVKWNLNNALKEYCKVIPILTN